MDSSNSSTKSGNTKQISPAKHWVFTLNNYSKDDLGLLSSISSINRYVFQQEVGENGTPHLQGYVEFKTKKRPVSEIKFSQAAHWETTRNVKAAIAYCYKSDGTQVPGTVQTFNIKIPKPLKLIDPDREWEVEMLSIIKEEPDDRTIYWLFEENGNVGKSQFTKYLCAKHDALVVSGKSADAKYMIMKYAEAHDGVYPELIIYDVPRCNLEYVSWEGLEKIKDGCFASTKYECSMVLMNSPHIICFANDMPPTEKLSTPWNGSSFNAGKVLAEVSK